MAIKNNNNNIVDYKIKILSHTREALIHVLDFNKSWAGLFNVKNFDIEQTARFANLLLTKVPPSGLVKSPPSGLVKILGFIL